MKASDFIINKLNGLVELFPEIKCAYEFDGFDNTHTVEILPYDFYNSNTSFNKILNEIDIAFIEQFPFDGLYFIDNTSIVPIKNTIYETKGKAYDSDFTYTFAMPQDVLFISKLNITNDKISNHEIINTQTCDINYDLNKQVFFEIQATNYLIICDYNETIAA